MIVLHGRRLQLTIHFSFFAVLLLLTRLTRSDWGLWCVGACLLHEAGHILAYSAFGAFPKAIHLKAGGIRIVPPDRPLTPKAEAPCRPAFQPSLRRSPAGDPLSLCRRISPVVGSF